MTFGLSAGAIGLIGAGAAVAGGVIASSGAKSAANTQAQAAQAANDTNKQIFNEQVGLQAPFRDTGLAANNRLAFLLGLQPGSTGAPSTAGPTPSFGGLSPQMLTQGSDGVFSPTASIGPSAPQGFNEQAYLAANPDVADYIQRHPPGSVGYTTALQHYQTFGQQEHRDLGTPQAAPPAIATSGQPAGANNLSSSGSLAQPFSPADFAADGAPKVPAFNQAVPTAPELGQFQDNTNLAQFQDMPAFNPDMMKEDPGYQFRLDQGLKGVENSASARGGVFSGAAGKALENYGQDYASGEYGNAFNRYQTTRANALQTYNTNIGTQQANRTNQLQDYATNLGTQQQNFGNANTNFNNKFQTYQATRANSLQDYQSAYDRFQQNRANVINPLMSVLGAGQQATNATSSAAQNFGAQSSAATMAAGNAAAAGQVGSVNALTGGVSAGVNGFQQNQLMNLLLSRQPAGASTSVPPNPFA